MKTAIALVLVLSTAWYAASMPLPHSASGSATLQERNRGMPVHRQDDQERGRVQQQAVLSARNQAYFHGKQYA